LEKINKIAIIGASYLQLPLVLKCKGLRYYTICFAYDIDAICKEYCDEFHAISVIDKEKILLVCKDLKIDAVLTIASDVAVPTVNYIANQLKLNGNTIRSSNLCTDKNVMKNELKKAKLKTAKFCKLGSEQEINKLNNFKYPLIIKPSDRSGSLGVTKIDSLNDLLKIFTAVKNLSFNGNVIVEEFILGHEISVETISFKGNHFFLAFTDKVTSGAPHFVELEHHQPSMINNDLKETIQKVLTKALNALEIINGAAHSELIIDSENNIYINEIGARMGGDFIGSHLVELSTGYDYLNGVIEVALGKFTLPILTNKAYSGVLFLSSETDFSKKINTQNTEIIEFEIRNKKNSFLTKSSDRNGYYIYQSNKKINFELL